MDLNVKLQGLKYNFKKVQGCFCKIPSADYFLDLLNYFSKGKSMEYVHGVVSRVYGGLRARSMGSLNPGCRLGDLRSGFKIAKCYALT
jgi:hypothetical protein